MQIKIRFFHLRTASLLAADRFICFAPFSVIYLPCESVDHCLLYRIHEKQTENCEIWSVEFIFQKHKLVTSRFESCDNFYCKLQIYRMLAQIPSQLRAMLILKQIFPSQNHELNHQQLYAGNWHPRSLFLMQKSIFQFNLHSSYFLLRVDDRFWLWRTTKVLKNNYRDVRWSSRSWMAWPFGCTKRSWESFSVAKIDGHSLIKRLGNLEFKDRIWVWNWD